MNNEPVAYVYQNFGIGRVAWLTEVPPDGTKLYTHPVKELTDEEIMKIWGEEDNELYYSKWAFIEFARAILRKAQDK
jgi:hypothetical protein